MTILEKKRNTHKSLVTEFHNHLASVKDRFFFYSCCIGVGWGGRLFHRCECLLLAWLIDVMMDVPIIRMKLWHFRCMSNLCRFWWKINIPLYRSSAHQFRVDVWWLLKNERSQKKLQEIIYLWKLVFIVVVVVLAQRFDNYRQSSTIFQISSWCGLLRWWLMLNHSHSTDFHCKKKTRQQTI